MRGDAKARMKVGVKGGAKAGAKVGPTGRTRGAAAHSVIGGLVALSALAVAPNLIVGQATGTPPDPTPPLELSAVVTDALAGDPELGAARAAADASLHAFEGARAERLPDVGVSGTAVRHQDPMIVAPLHGFDPAAPPAFDRTLIQARMGVSWTAWDGGGRSARIRRADAGRGAAEARVDAVRQERIAATTGAYLDVLTGREVVRAHRHRQDALAEERERVARHVAEGSAPRLELLRAEAELEAARAEATAAGASLRVAEARLARLLGVPVHGVAGRTLRDVLLVDVPSNPTSDLLANADSGAVSDAPATPSPGPGHPALAAARARADAARAGVAAAEARRLPTIETDGALEQYGGASSDFTPEWRAAVRISWPVWTGGARSAGEDRAKAEAREAVEEARAVDRELRIAADRAVAAEAEAAARVSALTAAETRFAELVRVERLALDEGVGVQSDWLRAEAGLLEARTALAAARRSRIRARISLAAAKGELTPDRLALWTSPGEPVPAVTSVDLPSETSPPPSQEER